MKEYDQLVAISKKIHLTSSISHLLEWDQETCMPKEGFLFRSEQIELIASLAHKEKTKPSFKKALSKLIDLDTGKILVKGLSFAQTRALAQWRHDFLIETSLPTAFVKKWAKTTSEAISIWGRAKKENNFSLFAPHLEKIIGLCQDKISYLGYKEHPYDALLSLYDPERKTSQVDQLFSELGKTIPSYLQQIFAQKPVEDSFLQGPIEKEQVLKFCHELLEKIGYEFSKGRLDLSNHPFSTTMHPTDSRITTRCFPNSYMETISATIHEAGHAFYEMGLNVQYYGTPLCQPVSMSIHESQSRFWETCLGQSEPFWQYFLPILKTHLKSLGHSFEKVPLKDFYKAINKVSKTPIRVDADEVSYPMHVIVRFELEKALITSTLNVKDLPEAWNELMKKFLNITPQNNAEGCLQDVHWSFGGFGYFPTYALGNLYATCMFNAFTKQFPNWEKQVASGEFAFIKSFLSEHVYQYGRQYTGDELLKRLSGETLSTAPYLSYLKAKYLH